MNLKKKGWMRLFGNIFFEKLCERFTENIALRYPYEYFEKNSSSVISEIMSILKYFQSFKDKY